MAIGSFLRNLAARLPPRRALVLTLVLALVERVLLWRFYPVRVVNDTGTYRRLAESILHHWENYDGVRTPGYPAFLALLKSNEGVYLGQLALGVGITLVFFVIGWRLFRNPLAGTALALAHTLNLGQLFFEAHLMSETLATFWVALTLLAAFLWFEKPQQRPWLAAGIGLAGILAGLTRPLFLFLPFWLGLALALVPGLKTGLTWRERLRALDWRTLLAAWLPAGALLFAWMAFIHQRFGIWNVTTITGYNLIQHTGYYFEYVPDEYAALRDVYLRYRDARIAQYGTQGNAIWQAIPEMSAASGLGFYDLSETLRRLSLQLIREHPHLYLHYALKGWWLFWRAPIYWSATNLLTPAWVAQALAGLILAERLILFAVNLLFLLLSPLPLFWRRVRAYLNGHPFLGVLAATLWVTSVLQTLPDHGDNPRFLVPMQSWVVVWVIAAGVALWRQRSQRKMI